MKIVAKSDLHQSALGKEELSTPCRRLDKTQKGKIEDSLSLSDSPRLAENLWDTLYWCRVPGTKHVYTFFYLVSSLGAKLAHHIHAPGNPIQPTWI